MVAVLLSADPALGLQPLYYAFIKRADFKTELLCTKKQSDLEDDKIDAPFRNVTK